MTAEEVGVDTLGPAPSQAATARARPRSRRHRADIEGLRALAVGLVVAYHAGLPGFTGGYVGVDAFFVISGFLITRLLVDEVQARGTLSFSGFYARRARRLLPMATLVLVGISVAFSIVLLPLDQSALRDDVWSAALYVSNWHFAASSLVYGTTSSDTPVLHYWSLSLEEQFYLVWPVVLFVVTRRWRSAPASMNVMRRVTIALAAIAVVSLALSIILTSRSAPYAYYGLHTRAWELAGGGLLAIWSMPGRRCPERLVPILGWAGFGCVILAAVTFSNSTTFPGIAAVLPVAGTLLIIGAGCGRSGGDNPFAVGRMFSLRPVTYGGRISYSIYLWHWPCLILLGTLAAANGTRAGSFTVAHGWRAVVAVLIAFALSAMSNRFIENPARRAAWMRAPRHALGAGAVMMAATVAVAAVLLPVSQGVIHGPVVAYVAPLPVGESAVPAANGIHQAPVHVRLAVTLRQARADHTVGTGDCYSSYQQSVAPAACVFGDPHGTVNVALIGDSHAEALFPALDRVAIANHWKLWLWAKPACPMIDLKVRLPQFDQTYPWCSSWQRSVLSRLAAIPELSTVFVTNYAGVATIPDRFSVDGGSALSVAQVPAAWRQAWSITDRQLSAVSHEVVMIRDVPQPLTDVPDCIEAHAPDITACSNSRAGALTNETTLYQAELPVSTSTTHFIDLNAVLCPANPCPVVTAGGDVIYRDNEHLTATVSTQLAPVLAAELKALVPIGH